MMITHCRPYNKSYFFKELGFPLKEIKEILEKPDFDRIDAFKKQKELFLLKRNRIDWLIQLLERVEKEEQCMSFREFDLSDYINALEDFKSNQIETVIQHWGSIENFDMFIQKIKDDEEQVAKLASSSSAVLRNIPKKWSIIWSISLKLWRDGIHRYRKKCGQKINF